MAHRPRKAGKAVQAQIASADSLAPDRPALGRPAGGIATGCAGRHTKAVRRGRQDRRGPDARSDPLSHPQRREPIGQSHRWDGGSPVAAAVGREP